MVYLRSCRKKIRLLVALTFLCVFGILAGSFCAYADAEAKAKAKEIQEVKTIEWEGRATREIQVRGKNGEKLTINSGAKVVVTDRGYHSGQSHVIRYKGMQFKVPHGAVSIENDLCSVKKEGDYNRATKEWFVNVKHKFRSKTDYLIWTSLDKQRVNVFHREGGKWVYVKKFKCSTGKAENPTYPSFGYQVSFKSRLFHYTDQEGYEHTYSYYVEFAGSGFHVWPGGRKRGIFGEHTASSGCIRLGSDQAKWMYSKIPVKTKVVVW